MIQNMKQAVITSLKNTMLGTPWLKKHIVYENHMIASLTEAMTRSIITADQYNAIYQIYDSHFSDHEVCKYPQISQIDVYTDHPKVKRTAIKLNRHNLGPIE